jgi:hypothetical protein
VSDAIVGTSARNANVLNLRNIGGLLRSGTGRFA